MSKVETVEVRMTNNRQPSDDRDPQEEPSTSTGQCEARIYGFRGVSTTETPRASVQSSKLRIPPRKPRFTFSHIHLMTRSSL